jgi:sugar transferase EpsL
MVEPHATLAMRQRGISRHLKRAFDVAGAASVLAVASPLLAVTAVSVRAFLGTPVLFRQRRPGRGGVPFEVLKLRTMTDARDEQGQLLPDARRLTSLGRLLRRLSVDELPQLWNVLRGDMSLVGPRPLLMQYLARYTPEQARRHHVLPGITGWCQVNGRNALSWEEKFALDVWYVDHWSLLLDLKILCLTAATLFKREGVAHGSHVTMPEFLGYEAGAVAAPEYR